jgi:cytochrome b561
MNDDGFREPRSLGLRLWHWLNAAMILGLLGTVLLRKTLLSWRDNAALIEAKLREAGIVITPELAKGIAIEIRNPLWQWHVYFGYALGALLLGRVLVALRVVKQPARDRPRSMHDRLVKLGYLALYTATLLMVVSGGLLAFKSGLGLSPDIAARVKAMHELMQWFFVLFVGAHLMGVLIAENGPNAGMVSRMIHGGGPDKN